MFQFGFDFPAHWPLTEPATVSAYQVFIFDECFPLKLFNQFVSIVTMIFRFEEAFFGTMKFVSELKA